MMNHDECEMSFDYEVVQSAPEVIAHAAAVRVAEAAMYATPEGIAYLALNGQTSAVEAATWKALDAKRADLMAARVTLEIADLKLRLEKLLEQETILSTNKSYRR